MIYASYIFFMFFINKGQTMNVFLMQNEMQGCTVSGKKLLRKRDLKSLIFSLSLKRTDIFDKVQLSSSSVQLRPAPDPRGQAGKRGGLWEFGAFQQRDARAGSHQGKGGAHTPSCAGLEQQGDELHGAFQSWSDSASWNSCHSKHLLKGQ